MVLGVEAALRTALAVEHDIVAIADSLVDSGIVAGIDGEFEREDTVATVDSSERNGIGVGLIERLAVPMQRVALTDRMGFGNMIGAVDFEFQPVNGIIVVNSFETIPVDARRGIGDRGTVLVIRITIAIADIYGILDEVGRIETDGQPDNTVAALRRSRMIGIDTTGSDILSEEIIVLADSAFLRKVGFVLRMNSQYQYIRAVAMVFGLRRQGIGACVGIGVPMEDIGLSLTDGSAYRIAHHRMEIDVIGGDTVAAVRTRDGVDDRTAGGDMLTVEIKVVAGA